jgi:hypothetical protein
MLGGRRVCDTLNVRHPFNYIGERVSFPVNLSNLGHKSRYPLPIMLSGKTIQYCILLLGFYSSYRAMMRSDT